MRNQFLQKPQKIRLIAMSLKIMYVLEHKTHFRMQEFQKFWKNIFQIKNLEICEKFRVKVFWFEEIREHWIFSENLKSGLFVSTLIQK